MSLPDFSCPVYTPADWTYRTAAYQYATTSNSAASMSPAAIIYPQYPNADADVVKAIQYAAANGLGVAVRTGGHAYSGTSSTSGNNIQLDLSQAYNEWSYDENKGLLTLGVSFSLLEFNTKLKCHCLFMPTGQCYNVHVGGHVQTGGYGQLSRAFGLFGDHVESFDIFLAGATTPKTIWRDSTAQSDKDLFFAILGGGPGNYGIVTHITIRPLKDSDHQYARAFKQIIPYDPKVDHDVLVRLLELTREWENAPGDYDFSFTLAAAEDDYLLNVLGIASYDDFMVRLMGGSVGSSPFNVLSVFFQYSNHDNKPDTYDPSWCNKIKSILATANHYSSWWEQFKEMADQGIIDHFSSRQDDDVFTKISDSVTRLWTYQGVREFNYPFLKNDQVTDKVAAPDWPEWAAGRMDAMVGSEGLMLVVQCQNFGGENSAVVQNGKRGQTAYAWRNTTIGYSLDIFINDNVEGARKLAEDWQATNRCEGVGLNGKFSTTDHRWFWASHGNTDMSKVWPYYYSKDDYARCCKIKQTVDPNGVFTPNTFVVGYTPETAPKHLAVVTAPTTVKPEQKLDDKALTKGHIDRAKARAEARGISAAELFRSRG